MKHSLWKLVLVGATCLAIGIAGTAGAAKLLTGKDIKDGSIGLKDLSRRARSALKGAAGARGPQGPKGDSGSPGGPGSSGSTAPSLVLGAIGVTAGSTLYAPPLGGNQTPTEASVQTPVPPGTGLIARDFAAAVRTAPGAGESVVVAFRVNGADTGLTCTIAAAATSCTAPSDTTVALPSGGRLSMRVTGSAGAASANASWGLRVVF